ncbi:Altered inheritance of mitochondria protein 6-like protein [Lachnellula hyalina]|uniref:Altered inheritance of mitochondria protein 6-like protein n=1 Tax=Lachnellula hyalina TaxID=1316788 RepID=A0A8H8U1J7_9HELO|nr:Altered inheritance of mitochondria protein 6-like protein [Lachnellula hyalina]TVY30476.1 Altered inheritance of mitochondria protein 6-like protein [Lachnellula hyalina]
MAFVSSSLALAWTVLSIATQGTLASPTPLDISPSLQEILNKAHQGPLYTYPTSLTQGIIPKAIHSHNDYWRDVPFYTALSVGAVSTESDVWLYNDTLFVGHEQGALTTAHLKTDGASTWPAVVKALEPLRSAGYLSSVNSTTFTSGAVTVIGTGNTPLSLVQPITDRDYFWDAPIPTLNSTFSNITSLISPIASTDFAANFGPVLGTSLDSTQLDLLRTQVKIAHGKGIKLRYWDQPAWPLSTRDAVWRLLRTEGVDFINADDVAAAAGDASW